MILPKKQQFKLKMLACKIFPFEIVKSIFSCQIATEKIETGHKLRIGNDMVVFEECAFDEFSFEELSSMFLHSILYTILDHEKRFSKTEVECENKLNRLLWSMASELARTEFLSTFNIPLPQIFLDPGMFQLPHNKSVEEYYAALKENKVDPQNTGGASIIVFGIPGQGSGESGSSEGETEVTDAYELSDEDEDDDLEREIAESAGSRKFEENINIPKEELRKMEAELRKSEAQMNILKGGLGRGLLSTNNGEFKYLTYSHFPGANDIVSKLRKLLINLACHIEIGKYYQSSRPRKKAIDESFLLTQVKRKGISRVACIVDVSGSTSPYTEEVFNAVCLAVKAVPLLDIYIGDTNIIEIKKRVKRPEQLFGLPQGGGTDMAEIMEEIDSTGKYHSLVVVTDTITPWPSKPTKAKSYVFPVGDYYYSLESVPEWITKVL